jgi:hypothetical protein
MFRYKGTNLEGYSFKQIANDKLKIFQSLLAPLFMSIMYNLQHLYINQWS